MLTAEAYQHELNVSCAAHNAVADKYWVEGKAVYGPLTELATSYEDQALIEEGVKVDVVKLMAAHIHRIKPLRELNERGLVAPNPVNTRRPVRLRVVKPISLAQSQSPVMELIA